MDFGVLLIIFQLIYLEGILSIDNAAVLGAMVAPLPMHEPIPWPRALQRLARPINRIMGPQRTAALRIGLPGAYIGRILMLFIANWVIRNPWLLFLGAVYLIKLAVDFLGVTPQEAEEAAAKAAGRPVPRIARPFWNVAAAVILVDLAFSLDNVVAAVALSRQFWVVVVGVLLGITTMRFAAQIFVYLIKRYPILETAAYLLVLNIGSELLLEDFAHVRFSDAAKFAISLGTLLIALLYGNSRTLQSIGRHFIWLKRALGFLSLFFKWVLRPFVWVLSGLVGVARVIARVVGPRLPLGRSGRRPLPGNAGAPPPESSK
ncbi:MAG TPA: tellurium resistance protein TerC [bacterium]